MTAAGKKHLLTVLNYPGAGHLIEPPFSPHCRVARLNKKSTSCSVMPRKSSAFPSVNTWRTHGGVCVCVFVLVTLVHGGKTKPHSDAQEDAWLKILAYLRHHLYSTPWDSMVKNSATKKISHLADCDLCICPHWDTAAAGNSRDTMLNFWKLLSCFFMLFTF